MFLKLLIHLLISNHLHLNLNIIFIQILTNLAFQIAVRIIIAKLLPILLQKLLIKVDLLIRIVLLQLLLQFGLVDQRRPVFLNNLLMFLSKTDTVLGFIVAQQIINFRFQLDFKIIVLQFLLLVDLMVGHILLQNMIITMTFMILLFLLNQLILDLVLTFFTALVIIEHTVIDFLRINLLDDLLSLGVVKVDIIDGLFIQCC